MNVWFIAIFAVALAATSATANSRLILSADSEWELGTPYQLTTSLQSSTTLFSIHFGESFTAGDSVTVSSSDPLTVQHWYLQTGRYLIHVEAFRDTTIQGAVVRQQVGSDSMIVNVRHPAKINPLVGHWSIYFEKMLAACDDGNSLSDVTIDFYENGKYLCLHHTSALEISTGYYQYDSGTGSLFDVQGYWQISTIGKDNYQIMAPDNYLYLFAKPLAGVAASSATTDHFSAFPNPFKASVTLNYALTSSGETSAEIFDELGRVVRLIQLGRQSVGEHKMSLSVGDLPAGVYHLVLTSGPTRFEKQIVHYR